MKKVLLLISIICAMIHFSNAQPPQSDPDGCPLDENGNFDPIPGLPPFCHAKYASTPGPGFPGNPNPIHLNEVTIYPSSPAHPSNPANPWYPFIFLPVPTPTPSAANPCAVLATANANGQVRAWIDNLRASTGLNYEKGVLFYGDNPIPIQGGIGQSGISFSLYDRINGMMHSHSSGDLSIYSFDDLVTLAKLKYHGLMSDPNSFFYGVFTDAGKGYMLTIDNPTLFTSFASTFAFINPGSNPLSLFYEDDYVNSSNTPAQNLQNFLQFLDQNNSGLKLLEYDSTNRTWTPKKLVNNSVTPNPC
ncbi:hypothetical protein SAMN06265348_107341 [Pedobacter westerhofensis]|uniref:Uncharacterized protein n=1 Tax=Pedobacter westerhofensis TaxID=425512 RepID=A0A521EB31_9SPHI|nr:hypothetical protein [Pedobacter westerhofensis]SMO81123.1 hypothetical protein SAMN06265348_107341 [Pedobacter westerhofensis]